VGYVRNREGFIRTGFRPVATNPYAATQLGLVPRHLGQNHPFTPGGGYGLHGLGQGPIVPQGATVQYTGTWVFNMPTLSSANQTPDGILAAVVAALQQDGFQVISSSTSGAILAELEFWIKNGTFTVTIEMQVNSGGGYSEPSDIASIVDHEAYTATGIMPTGSQVVVLSTSGPAPSAAGSAASSAAATLTSLFTPTPGSTTSNMLLIAAAGLLGVLLLKEL
jgi:hypothetical protein